MRFCPVVLLAALMVLLLPEGKVGATGNVLLPAENGSGGSLPNLGLMPAEPEPPAPPPAPPEAKPAAAGQEKPATPALPAAQPDAAAKLPDSIQPSKPADAPAPLPHVLRVSLLETSFWTPADIATVSGQLGIPKALVKLQCRPDINGMLITDRGASPVAGDLATSFDVRYDGTVANAMLSVSASCASAPKPAPYAYIQRTGGRFAISLGSAFCAPQAALAATVRQVSVIHAANGNDSCAFQ